ncbi:LysR family transcriptional regulator [Jatrophihabitans endophyticus]|uniref:LysR family transcriptional regulator n=1 Tax=Jatrophihabitans endophyticus TaxID=1206085 RepID=UPI0019F6CCAF|nr:LysR family transcriptional regulator [Jatrophihabitans endophyticus]MBE7187408.1 LysR family transcriptional regulator [Jatrophihabitans endophyticus]
MIDARLHVLRMLAEHGTVTEVARHLNYTPSAVSHQLQTLARDLEVTLLVQDGRRVRLTPAARTLLEHTDELFAQWETIRAEVARSAGESGGSLRMCGFSTAAAALLPFVARTVVEAFPRVVPRIIEADPEDCFDLLLADRADLAVVVATQSLPPSTDPRFDQQPLLDDPLDLLVPENHRLAGRSSVLLRQAADEPWLLDRPGRPHHQLVLAACAAAGFTPTAAHEAAEWDTGAALVAAGFGVALVPRLARLPAGYPIVRVPLRGDPQPARHIVTAVRRGSRRDPVLTTALAALETLAVQRELDARDR